MSIKSKAGKAGKVNQAVEYPFTATVKASSDLPKSMHGKTYRWKEALTGGKCYGYDSEPIIVKGKGIPQDEPFIWFARADELEGLVREVKTKEGRR